MATDLQQLNAVLQGGARANRFQVEFQLPAGVGGNLRNINLLAKTFPIPGVEIGTIEVKYKGLTGRLSDNSRVVTATTSPNFRLPANPAEILNAFYDWASKCAPLDGSQTVPSDYKTDIVVRQLGTNKQVTFSWKLKGCWVSAIPEQEMNSEEAESIREFAPTLTVDDVEII